MDEVTVLLHDHEWLAFAGLTRLLVRSDGRLSGEERVAIEAACERLTPPAGLAAAAYRTAPIETERRGPGVGDWLDRAGRILRDDGAIREAALRVDRPAAREAIYLALFDIAAADVVVDAEWPLLDWLREHWGIR